MTQKSTSTPAGESGPSPSGIGPAAGRSLSGLTWWSAGLIVLGFAPLLLEFFTNIWRLPHYQFFPGALAAAGFMAWSRLKEVARPLNPGQPWVTLPLLLFSFALLTLAVLLGSPWLAAIAAVVCLIGVIWWSGGWALMKVMVPAMLLLLIIIPPPFGMDSMLTLFLRRVATSASSRFLDLLRVVHCVSGNVIELPEHKLLVEEACSGINSVLFISAFTLFYLLWRRRSFWCYLICLPAALGFVVMGNVARITLGAWAQFHNGMDLLTGWKHETIGLILVAIYVGLVMSLEHLLSGVPRPGPSFENASSHVSSPPASGPVRRISPVWGWAAGILFCIMGLAGAARHALHQENHYSLLSKSALREGATFELPERIGPWRRMMSGEPALKKIETTGLHSVIWPFVNPSATVAVIAFDYPFWGYHDVTQCYIANGWDIMKRERISKDDKTPPWLEMEMRKDMEGHGSLWVGTINEQGQWMEVAQVKRSLLDRIRTLGPLGNSEETSYRVQLLITGPSPLSADDRESAARLFQQARALLVQQLFGQLNQQKKVVP
jgi:exosortase